MPLTTAALFLSIQSAAPCNPSAEWVMIPDHRLPGTAGQLAAPFPNRPVSVSDDISTPLPPLNLRGGSPTDRRTGLESSSSIPTTAFSCEFWILDHVNQPVGALAAARDPQTGDPLWLIAYHDDHAIFTPSRDLPTQSLSLPEGWKQYWHHIVLTNDAAGSTLYHNGLAIATAAPTTPAHNASPAFELAAYTTNEPYMHLEHLVKACRIYPCTLDTRQVGDLFRARQEEVEQGLLPLPGTHFTAGPYLHMATTSSMNLVWETSRPTNAVIEYGTAHPLTRQLVIDEPSRIQEATIGNLDPDTTYFYRVVTTDSEGTRTTSDDLSFKTAAPAGQAIRFAVMGDPEARPHVNRRIADLVWQERPDFVINVGDLTDGGHQPDKFQWNYEYFLGLGQLHARVPAFPVPGNGEGDLYWYSRYHRFPSPSPTEGYYTFSYGDIQFFMLDSNRSASDFRPGGEQYEWLHDQLERSKARWKIAAHHHPTYTSDEDDYGNTWTGASDLGDTDVRQILDLYEDHGVNVVFFGHLHTYERTLPILDGKPNPNGVVYIQAGGAGGNHEDFAPTPSWFSAKTHRGHHYLMCSQFDDTLEVRMYGHEGALIDSVTIVDRD